MMKIAYYIYSDTHQDDGVVKKVIRQTTAWRRAGHDLRLFFISRTADTSKSLSSLPVEVEIIRSRLDLLFGPPRRLANRVLEWNPDLVYVRFTKYYPGIGRLLRAKPTILEINTFDLGEIKVKSGFLVQLYHRLTREFLLQGATGFSFLSDELAGNYRKYAKPYIVIGDSIDLENYSAPIAPANARPRLVFIASSTAPWVGLDKIFEMAELTPDWDYDIVGLNSVGQQQDTNLHFHGFLSQEDYDPILRAADIGISSLALHRIGVSEITPLKTREYLAYGLPCITAYQDSDFPGGAKFLLQLPNKENNVRPNLSRIRDFVRSWAGVRVPQAEIGHLGAEVKERKRLDFFERVTGKYDA